MLNTAGWPQVDLDVLKDVHLDPKNVRLESADAKVEADIMADLFANENALSLVEGICKVGFLTHETPVVLKRRGKYVVVEGNRRLAALKAIQNPMLVPDYQARVSALANTLVDRTVLSKVRAIVAPNQTQADQLIAAIHTGNLRKPWTPARQAAFFQAQIDAGRKLKDLVERYPTIEVRKFVFRAHILNMFKSVQYKDVELVDFLSTKKWARGLSTLARIYESSEFLEITGLLMDDKGNVTKSISDSAFDEIATEIVRGMYEENINTRSLNTVSSPRYFQLMAEIRRIIGESESNDGSERPVPNSSNRKKGGAEAAGAVGRTASNGGRASATKESATDSSQSATSSTAPDAGQGSTRARKKKQTTLDLNQITPDQTYPEALKSLLGELSEINVQKFPNGSFLMIRAALEKSIKAFAEAKKVDIKSAGFNTNGRVQLHNAVSWLKSYVESNGPKHLEQVIKRVSSGKLVTYTSSTDSLNAINHNHHFAVDPDEVIAMWASVDSIMRYVMKP